MSHLENAKNALTKRARYGGAHTAPTHEDLLEAIKEIIAHLERSAPPLGDVRKYPKDTFICLRGPRGAGILAA